MAWWILVTPWLYLCSSISPLLLAATRPGPVLIQRVLGSWKNIIEYLRFKSITTYLLSCGTSFTKLDTASLTMLSALTQLKMLILDQG